MRDAGMATTQLPEIGERMSECGRAIDMDSVASRVVALARVAAAMHMHGAFAPVDESGTPSNREGGS